MRLPPLCVWTHRRARWITHHLCTRSIISLQLRRYKETKYDDAIAWKSVLDAVVKRVASHEQRLSLLNRLREEGGRIFDHGESSAVESIISLGEGAAHLGESTNAHSSRHRVCAVEDAHIRLRGGLIVFNVVVW